MANCKDCIHYDVCESDSEDVALNLTWANKCQHFKDKADVVPKSEVERCKDCIYFQPDFVLQNGERRPYTEEEIKNGKIVTGDVGINCGSRCERFDYWEENKIPVWFSENDYCSYFKKKYTESEDKG